MRPPQSRPPVALGAQPLAAGTYTKIEGVEAPSLVGAGQNVPVGALGRNLYSTPIYMAMTAEWDSTEFRMFPDFAEVPAGVAYQFGGGFVMPPKSVTVRLYSYYWSVDRWVLDDQYSLLVSLQPTQQPAFSNLSASYRRV